MPTFSLLNNFIIYLSLIIREIALLTEAVVYIDYKIYSNINFTEKPHRFFQYHHFLNLRWFET